MPLPSALTKPPQRSAPQAKRRGCASAGSGALRQCSTRSAGHSTADCRGQASYASSQGVYAKSGAGGALRHPRWPGNRWGASGGRVPHSGVTTNASPPRVSLRTTFDNGPKRAHQRLAADSGKRVVNYENGLNPPSLATQPERSAETSAAQTSGAGPVAFSELQLAVRGRSSRRVSTKRGSTASGIKPEGIRVLMRVDRLIHGNRRLIAISRGSVLN